MVKDIPPPPPTKSTKQSSEHTNHLIDIWVNFHNHPYSYKIEFVKKKKELSFHQNITPQNLVCSTKQ